MDHHGSISHLFFFNKKHHRKASGFLQDSPGLGGEANPPWNRTPPTESLRSQKEEGHEKSGGSIEAAGGGYVFKTWELKELNKNWGGSTWNSCIEIFYTRYDLLSWWWYDIWGNKSYGKWCEGEVLNLWNITTIMFRGFEVFFALFIFSVCLSLIFCDNMLCFLTPKKHLALCELHSPQVIHFYVLNLSWYYRFFSYSTCFMPLKISSFPTKIRGHVLWQIFIFFMNLSILAQNLNIKKAPWPHRWVMVAQPSCSHGCVCRQASNMSRWAEPPRRRRTQAPWPAQVGFGIAEINENGYS